MTDELMTPEAMDVAVSSLRDQFAAAAVECAAIIGWSGVFRAIRDAATSTEDGYVAGVAEAAALHIEQQEE